jgi:tetratricopeptide (TPR) repeat protein
MRYWSVVTVCAVLVAAGCGKSERTKEQFFEAGTQYAQQQKYAEAILEYRNALKLDPKFAAAHGKLGEALLEANDGAGALRELVVAADLSPKDAPAQIKAGQVLLLARQFEDARTRADRALEADPNNAQALMLRGNASAGMKDIDSAIADANEALRAAPNDPDVYGALGAMQLTGGKAQEAESAFKRAAELNAKSALPLVALANYYFAVGRRADVEPILKQAIAREPASIPAARALATFYVLSKRIPEAEAPLKTAADLSKDVASRLALGDYYLATKREAEAVKLFTLIAEDKAGFGDATVRLAAIDYANKRPEDAKRKIEAVLAQQPKNAEAMMVRARFDLAERKIDEALASAKAATAADPKSAAAQYLVGTLEVELKDYPAAMAAFGEALKLNPLLQPARRELARLNLRKGNPAESIQLANATVQANPKGVEDRLLLARSQIAGGQLDGAQEVLKGLAAEHDEIPAVHALRGALLWARQDRTGAAREYDRALTLDPNSLEALNGRVSIDLVDNKTEAARARVEERLARTPKNVGVMLIASNVYGALKDAKSQEAVLRKALEIDANNTSASMGLATLYFQQGKLDQARADYEALERRNPKNLAASMMLGLILEIQKRPQDAQKVYERVVAANPSASMAANNLAYLYAENGGNLDVALDLAQKALQQQPDSPQVNDTLGWVYYKKDMAGMAITPFETAIKRDATNATYQYHAGLAYARSGNRSKAREAFREALRLKPDFPEATAALQKVGS